MTAVITKYITFSCDEKLYNDVRNYCKKKRYTVSDFMRECAKKELKKET